MSSRPGRTKRYPGIGIAEEKCLRLGPTCRSQLLSATMNLGSDKGPRRRLISKEVVDGSSESLDGLLETSTSLASSVAICCPDGLGSEDSLIRLSSWTLPGEVFWLWTSRSPSAGIHPVHTSISKLEAERFTIRLMQAVCLACARLPCTGKDRVV